MNRQEEATETKCPGCDGYGGQHSIRDCDGLPRGPLPREGRMTGFPRPWCCPEPRCVPVFNAQVEAKATPGESFICFGRMERPVAFTYDGSEHTNNLNHCDYTPLKGVLRWQENEADWQFVSTAYRRALAKLKGRWGP